MESRTEDKTDEDQARLDLARTTCLNRLSAEYEAGIERLPVNSPLVFCLSCDGKNTQCNKYSVLSR